MQAKRLVVCAIGSILVAGCTAQASDDVAEHVAQSQSALTVPAIDWAVAWMSNASTGAISTTWQASSSGSTIVGRRIGTGHYEADLVGLGGTTGGNVQVVAYGSNARCKAQYLDEFPKRVTVRCFAPGGAPVDSRYVVSYVRDSRTSSSVPNDHIRAAYLVHSNVGALWESTYRWNSNGGPITVDHPALGRYRVLIGGGATGPLPPGSVAQVTAYGSTPTYCTVAGWGDDGPPEGPAVDRAIEVRCFDGNGAAADSPFSLRYWTWGSFGGREGAWAFDPTPTVTPFTPAATYWDDSGGAGTPTITRTAIGKHDVLVPGRTFEASGALANAVAEDGRYCTIRGWDSLVKVGVQCFAANGTAADTPFTAAYFDGVTGSP